MFKKKLGILSFIILIFTMLTTLSVPGISAETMSSGWIYPTGSSNFCGYLGWLGYNSGWGYHLAQDMCNNAGKPVYSIGNGTVISSGNHSGYGCNGTCPGGCVLVRYEAADGTKFTAMYGHLDNQVGTGDISEGEIIGYTRSDWNPPHLHFSIHPGSDPEPNNPWRGYTSSKDVTYGFTDPMSFLNAHPFSSNSLPDLDVSYVKGHFSGESDWRKDLVMYQHETKTIQLKVKVSNDGEAEADKDDFKVKYYFSTNKTFDHNSDVKIGSDTVNYDLGEAGKDDDSDTEEMEISSSDALISAIKTPGTYYFFVWIDSDLKEEHKSNNTSNDDSGSDEYVKITVLPTPPAPAANFSASPVAGKVPLTVSFTDQSTSGPTAWSWNFGDGATSITKNPTHTYSSTGTFTVSLTVANAYGSNTSTKSDYITVYVPAVKNDFNNDGSPDILWRNTSTGKNLVWYMNGRTTTSMAYLTTVTDPAWTIVGTADFNMDGNPDILWRNTTSGKNLVWYMNGVAITSTAYVSTVTDPAWTIVQ